MIFKIVAREDWQAARAEGVFLGSADDRRDGFIHFSAAHQVRETAAKHFKGVGGLVLVAADESALGRALVWEASRGGALFPHLYGPFPTASAIWERELALDGQGVPVIPEDIVP